MRGSVALVFLGTQTFVALWCIDHGPWWVDLAAIVTWAFAIFIVFTADRMMDSYEQSLRNRDKWRDQ